MHIQSRAWNRVFILVDAAACSRTARCTRLRDHHRGRLDEVVAVVADADGCTTFEVAERLTWSRPWDQSRGLVRRSAIGETYAHLFHLEQRGRLANNKNPDDHWHVVRPATVLPERHK